MTREEVVDALLKHDFRLSLTSIGNYERGERAPDFEVLRHIAAALQEDHFDVEGNFRVEFGPNGKAHMEALPQQLDLVFDQNNGVNVRIESVGQGLVIKRIPA